MTPSILLLSKEIACVIILVLFIAMFATIVYFDLLLKKVES